MVIRILPELKEIFNTEYLGVTLNDKLSSRTPHNNTICSKLSTGLFVIRRMMNNSVMRTGNSEHALFGSHLRYGIGVWGGTTAGHLQRDLKNGQPGYYNYNLPPPPPCQRGFLRTENPRCGEPLHLEATTYFYFKAPGGSQESG